MAGLALPGVGRKAILTAIDKNRNPDAATDIGSSSFSQPDNDLLAGHPIDCYDPVQDELLGWALDHVEDLEGVMALGGSVGVVASSPLGPHFPGRQHHVESTFSTSQTPMTGATVSRNLGSTSKLFHNNHVDSRNATAQTIRFVPDPPLPQSVINQGFKAEDFDPKKKWISQNLDPGEYRAYPPDLQDQHIFNGNPNNIAFGNIFRLATRYTNKEIFENVNQHRPHPVFHSSSTVTNRLTKAIQVEAVRRGQKSEDVRTWLNDQKRSNDVHVPIRQPKRSRDDQEQSPMPFGAADDRISQSPAKRVKTEATVMNGHMQGAYSLASIPNMTDPWSSMNMRQHRSQATPNQMAMVGIYVQPTFTQSHDQLSRMQQQPLPTPPAVESSQDAPAPRRASAPRSRLNRSDPHGLMGHTYHMRVKGSSSSPAVPGSNRYAKRPSTSSNSEPQTPDTASRNQMNGDQPTPSSSILAGRFQDVVDLTEHDDEKG